MSVHEKRECDEVACRGCFVRYADVMRRHAATSGQEPTLSQGKCQAALAAAQEEVAVLRDKYLRAAAARENARKQSELDACRRAADRLRRFSLRLIDVADNLEQVLAQAPDGDALRPRHPGDTPATAGRIPAPRGRADSHGAGCRLYPAIPQRDR